MDSSTQDKKELITFEQAKSIFSKNSKILRDSDLINVASSAIEFIKISKQNQQDSSISEELKLRLESLENAILAGSCLCFTYEAMKNVLLFELVNNHQNITFKEDSISFVSNEEIREFFFIHISEKPENENKPFDSKSLITKPEASTEPSAQTKDQPQKEQKQDSILEKTKTTLKHLKPLKIEFSDYLETKIMESAMDLAFISHQSAVPATSKIVQDILKFDGFIFKDPTDFNEALAQLEKIQASIFDPDLKGVLITKSYNHGLSLSDFEKMTQSDRDEFIRLNVHQQEFKALFSSVEAVHWIMIPVYFSNAEKVIATFSEVADFVVFNLSEVATYNAIYTRLCRQSFNMNPSNKHKLDTSSMTDADVANHFIVLMEKALIQAKESEQFQLFNKIVLGNNKNEKIQELIESLPECADNNRNRSNILFSMAQLDMLGKNPESEFYAIEKSVIANETLVFTNRSNLDAAVNSLKKYSTTGILSSNVLREKCMTTEYFNSLSPHLKLVVSSKNTEELKEFNEEYSTERTYYLLNISTLYFSEPTIDENSEQILDNTEKLNNHEPVTGEQVLDKADYSGIEARALSHLEAIRAASNKHFADSADRLAKLIEPEPSKDSDQENTDQTSPTGRIISTPYGLGFDLVSGCQKLIDKVRKSEISEKITPIVSNAIDQAKPILNNAIDKAKQEVTPILTSVKEFPQSQKAKDLQNQLGSALETGKVEVINLAKNLRDSLTQSFESESGCSNNCPTCKCGSAKSESDSDAAKPDSQEIAKKSDSTTATGEESASTPAKDWKIDHEKAFDPAQNLAVLETLVLKENSIPELQAFIDSNPLLKTNNFYRKMALEKLAQSGSLIYQLTHNPNSPANKLLENRILYINASKEEAVSIYRQIDALFGDKLRLSLGVGELNGQSLFFIFIYFYDNSPKPPKSDDESTDTSVNTDAEKVARQDALSELTSLAQISGMGYDKPSIDQSSNEENKISAIDSTSQTDTLSANTDIQFDPSALKTHASLIGSTLSGMCGHSTLSGMCEQLSNDSHKGLSAETHDKIANALSEVRKIETTVMFNILNPEKFIGDYKHSIEFATVLMPKLNADNSTEIDNDFTNLKSLLSDLELYFKHYCKSHNTVNSFTFDRIMLGLIDDDAKKVFQHLFIDEFWSMAVKNKSDAYNELMDSIADSVCESAIVTAFELIDIDKKYTAGVQLSDAEFKKILRPNSDLSSLFKAIDLRNLYSLWNSSSGDTFFIRGLLHNDALDYLYFLTRNNGNTFKKITKSTENCKKLNDICNRFFKEGSLGKSGIQASRLCQNSEMLEMFKAFNIARPAFFKYILNSTRQEIIRLLDSILTSKDLYSSEYKNSQKELGEKHQPNLKNMPYGLNRNYDLAMSIAYHLELVRTDVADINLSRLIYSFIITDIFSKLLTKRKPKSVDFVPNNSPDAILVSATYVLNNAVKVKVNPIAERFPKSIFLYGF